MTYYLLYFSYFSTTLYVYFTIQDKSNDLKAVKQDKMCFFDSVINILIVTNTKSNVIRTHKKIFFDKKINLENLWKSVDLYFTYKKLANIKFL